MSKLIKTFTAGSCGIHDAPDKLARMGFFPYLFGRLGFHSAPYALSSGATVQLFDFCAGERLLPDMVQMLAYMQINQPTLENGGLVREADIAFVEMSTPVEPLIGNDIVNFNRIEDFVVKPLRAAGVDRHLMSGWSQSLVNVRDDLPERARALLNGWPGEFEGDALARFAVENLRSRRLDVDGMVRDLETLRGKIRAPMALKLYDFKYMPDGRPIDWPAGFKAKQIEVARRMKLPTLDFAPVVQRLGATRLIGKDMAHWRTNAHGMQAELMYDFWADVLERPRLEAYPEWREARPALYSDYLEFLPQPARLSFPDLSHIPRQKSWRRGVQEVLCRHTGGSAKARQAQLGASRQLGGPLNSELVKLHRSRLEALGPRDSGLYAHYQARVEAENLISERDHVFVDLIHSKLPAYGAYAIMRAGLGELAFLIAATGRKVIACEPDRNRHAAIEEGRVRLEALGLLQPGLFTLRADILPEGPMKGGVLGVGSDVTHVRDDVAADPYFKRMPVFDALLVDLRLFLRLRNLPEEKAAAIDALRSVGFDVERRFHYESLSWVQKSSTARR